MVHVAVRLGRYTQTSCSGCYLQVARVHLHVGSPAVNLPSPQGLPFLYLIKDTVDPPPGFIFGSFTSKDFVTTMTNRTMDDFFSLLGGCARLSMTSLCFCT
jgi:hypothetical protein